MNIVVISDSYYPILSPVSSCMNNYIQELKKKHSIDIICPLSRLVSNDIYDQNIKYHFVSNWHNKLRALCNTKIDADIHKRFYSLMLTLIRFYGFLLSFFAFPTRMNWLTQKFYRELKKIEKVHQIDVLISASDPICSHIAAYNYKKNNPHTKWITFSFDPIASNYYNYNNILFKKSRIQRLHNLSKSIYNSSDFNITNFELYNQLISDYSLHTDKTFCFEYLLSQNINKKTKDNFTSTNYKNRIVSLNTFKFLYAGSLKKQLRNPQQMLSIITSIDNSSLSLFVSGDCDDIINQYKGSGVSVSRLIPRDEYIKLITSQDSDFLINIGNNGSLQMPSKLLELISTGKPLINFYYYKDYSYELVQKYPNGINVWQFDDNAINKITLFCNKKKGTHIDYEILANLYPRNVIQGQMNVLNNLLV